METKFKMGQKVRVIADGEVGEVIGIAIYGANNSGNTTTYTISAKEIDYAKKEFVPGIRTHREEELEDYKDA